MSCPKGASKWQKLTPKLVFLFLTLFTQLSEEEAKQQGAGKEDLTPDDYLERAIVPGEIFHILGPKPWFCWPAQGLSHESQHPAWREGAGWPRLQHSISLSFHILPLPGSSPQV